MKKIYASVLLLISWLLPAQNEFLDTSFGEQEGYTWIPGYDPQMFTAVIRHEDYLYALSGSNTTDNFLVKYDLDGIVQSDFGIGGKAMLGDSSSFDANSWAYANSAIYVTSDEKLMVVNGSYHQYETPSMPQVMVTKLNPDGSLDNDYGINSHTYCPLTHGLEILGSRKDESDALIVVGYNRFFDSENPSHSVVICQIDGSGNFEQEATVSFGFEFAEEYPISATITNNSVYVLFRSMTVADDRILKINIETMAPDAGFGENGSLVINEWDLPEYADAIHVSEDGSILVAGNRQIESGQLNYAFFIYKYLNNVLVSDFATDGIFQKELIPGDASVSKSSSVKLHGNDIFVTGHLYNWDNNTQENGFMMRLSKTGVPDDTFGIEGLIRNTNFGWHNVIYDYVYDPEFIVTCGTCPDQPQYSQLPCLVKYRSTPLALAEPGRETLSLFPNPVTDVLNIKSSAETNFIEIYDFTGRKLQELTARTPGQFDLSGLQPGNYLVRISVKKNPIFRKICKL